MLSPIQRAMIAALRHGQPDPVPTARLVDVIYGGRLDGGPDDAAVNVRVQIRAIRVKLAPVGIEIDRVIGRGRDANGYRIRPEHCGRLDALLMTA